MLYSKVTLTNAELTFTAWAGKQRYAFAVKNNYDPGLGTSKERKGPGNDINGCHTEYSASIMMNLYWRPHIGLTDQKDIGGLIEVRSTDLPNGHLIVKPETKRGNKIIRASGPYMLVIKDSDNEFRWGGWIMAEDALAKYPLQARHGDAAHWVPQSDLLDQRSLAEWIVQRRAL